MMARVCWSVRIQIRVVLLLLMLLRRMCGRGDCGGGFALVMEKVGLGGGRRRSEGSERRWHLRIEAGMERRAVGE